MNKVYLGIDYGRKRIGLAISEVGLIAKPLYTIENKGMQKNLVTLASLLKQYNVKNIVFGLPLNVNGSEGDIAAEVRVFSNALQKEHSVTIYFQDERYTSIEAEEYLRNFGITEKKKIAQLIDSIAATMILNDYLRKGERNNGI